jgi:hypothetical protein
VPASCPTLAHAHRQKAEEIRRGLAAGMRGPVLIKWCGQLLADRDERVARERAAQLGGRATLQARPQRQRGGEEPSQEPGGEATTSSLPECLTRGSSKLVARRSTSYPPSSDLNFDV